jgi:hypothetical protein
MNAETFERWYLLFDILGLDAADTMVADIVPLLAGPDVKHVARTFIATWPDGPAAVPSGARGAAVAAALVSLRKVGEAAPVEIARFVREDFAVMPSEFVLERELLITLWRAVFRRPGGPDLPAGLRARVAAAAERWIDPDLWLDEPSFAKPQHTPWDAERARVKSERLALPQDFDASLEPLRASVEVRAVRRVLAELGSTLAPDERSELHRWIRASIPDDPPDDIALDEIRRAGLTR